MVKSSGIIMVATKNKKGKSRGLQVKVMENIIDQIMGQGMPSGDAKADDVVAVQELGMEEEQGIEISMDKKKPDDNRLDGISDRNEVVASGVLVHKFDNGKKCLLTLMVRGGRKLDMQNYPQFICYDNVRDSVAGFKEGDHLQIHGHNVSVYFAKTGEFSDGIIADKVERTPSRLSKLTLEQGLGSHRDIPTAEFFVAGTVKSFELRNNTLHLIIRTQEEGKKATHSSYYMYPKDIMKIAQLLKNGKRVCAIGEVQTKKIEEEGKKPVYEQHNVISDISSIDDILSLKK